MWTMMKCAMTALLVLAGTGCRDSAEREVSQDSAMAGMEGMGGGAAPSGATQMMTDMDAHMARMGNATADSMRAMVPEHRQMVANMIAQFEREMRDMNMTADSAWRATVDSVRSDLRTMPDMSAQALRGQMAAHSARVRRMLEMHRSMMARMGH